VGRGATLGLKLKRGWRLSRSVLVAGIRLGCWDPSWLLETPWSRFSRLRQCLHDATNGQGFWLKGAGVQQNLRIDLPEAVKKQHPFNGIELHRIQEDSPGNHTMATIRKHKLTSLSSPQRDQQPLESRTMLAASSIVFSFNKNVSGELKQAFQQGAKFWGKFINTNKSLKLQIKKGTLSSGALGEYLSPRRSPDKKATIVISDSKKSAAEIKKDAVAFAAHELGHALTLVHTAGTIMDPSLTNTRTVVSKKQLDALEKQGYRKQGSNNAADATQTQAHIAATIKVQNALQASLLKNLKDKLGTNQGKRN
jgi:hypothetical protein